MARPSVYQDSYPNQLIEQMALGHFDYEIYADWDISKDTFYRWLREYPELKEAYDLGFAKCYKWWTIEGRARFAERDDKGFKFWIAVMRNKFHWGEEESQAKNVINIQNMNVLQQKDNNELIEYIQAKLQQTNLIEYQNESTEDGESGTS